MRIPWPCIGRNRRLRALEIGLDAARADITELLGRVRAVQEKQEEGATQMATTQEAIDELKVAVGELGTSVNAALDRLEQGKDDPEEIAAATAELREIAGKISAIGSTPTPDPEPVPE